jgi:DNA-binding IclR family transcriptional regulator
MLLAYLHPQTVIEHFERTGLQHYTEATIPDVDGLMRHLEQIRCQGYAPDQGEHEAEVRCVAAPIFDTSGNAAASVSVSGPAGRMEPLETNVALIELVTQAARTISARNGYRSPHSGARIRVGGM